MKTLTVNFFGGPGSGKSTICAGVFAWLKAQGINCEMALEFAKDYCWRRQEHNLANQPYVFGQQLHRIWVLQGQVEVVLTDGPLLHSLIYDSTDTDSFSGLIWDQHRSLRNMNIFLQRKADYRQEGRYHNEEQAKKIDQEILELLRGEPCFTMPGSYDSIEPLGCGILEQIGKAS